MIGGGGFCGARCGFWVALVAVPALSWRLARRHNYLICDVFDKRTPDSPPQHPRSAGELEHVHVAYTATADVLPGLVSSMISVARHVEDPKLCTIHVFLPPDAMTLADAVVECYRREVSRFRQAPEAVVHPMRLPPINTTGFVAPPEMLRFLVPEIYARLFMHEDLPASAERVLYIDVDTIIQADVTPLYRMKMEHVVALLEDGSGLGPYNECIKLNPEMRAHLEDVGTNNLFNIGVLLIDLRRWREEQTWLEVLRWVPPSKGCMGDQFSLNMAVREKFDRIPWTYNVAPLGHNRPSGNFMPKCMLERAVVLHWAGFMKPWHRVRNRHYDRLVSPYAPHHRCSGLPTESVNELYGGAA